MSEHRLRVDWPACKAHGLCAGAYELVSTNASGAVRGRQSVTVVDQGSVIVAGEGASAAAGGATVGEGRAAGEASGTAAGTDEGGQLASTGFRGIDLAAGAGVFVLAGTGLVLVASFPRHRKPESPAGAGRRLSGIRHRRRRPPDPAYRTAGALNLGAHETRHVYGDFIYGLIMSATWIQ